MCVAPPVCVSSFNPLPTTEIYPLSLHDALPICLGGMTVSGDATFSGGVTLTSGLNAATVAASGNGLFQGSRSEEHTSELQSLRHLVCRLLLEKENNNRRNQRIVLHRLMISDLIG